eukprot:1032874-Prorocentrum_minimum.AAC.1
MENNSQQPLTLIKEINLQLSQDTKPRIGAPVFDRWIAFSAGSERPPGPGARVHPPRHPPGYAACKHTPGGASSRPCCTLNVTWCVFTGPPSLTWPRPRSRTTPEKRRCPGGP